MHSTPRAARIKNNRVSLGIFQIRRHFPAIKFVLIQDGRRGTTRHDKQDKCDQEERDRNDQENTPVPMDLVRNRLMPRHRALHLLRRQLVKEVVGMGGRNGARWSTGLKEFSRGRGAITDLAVSRGGCLQGLRWFLWWIQLSLFIKILREKWIEGWIVAMRRKSKKRYAGAENEMMEKWIWNDNVVLRWGGWQLVFSLGWD